ncbi:condensation domain-containing protein [Granulosicoccus sp.]|nr:condensation domain-containing protein [Granulosicoccus sp.]
MSQSEEQEIELDIAVIGMSGKFPGADTVDAFWDNLCAGRESISFFTDEQLEQSGVSSELTQHGDYVNAAPTLANPGGFDAAFFGYTPKEALVMDPQHRLLLQSAWEALENAGYNCQDASLSSNLRVGVYASCAMNTYLLNTEVLRKFGTDYLPTLIGSDKDFLATRISHRLGLNGPSISVQTACSSSLVAIHLACQALLSNEIDMAIVGAATVKVPHYCGHLAQAGSVFSTDGHCRPFDANATGTIFGSGAGAVVLRRLNDAIANEDCVSAVVKASAVNNDGKSKAEFTAPSVHSQSEVIKEVHEIAGISADQIKYIEAHGTGTYLGDPIEIEALKKAFSDSTSDTGYCAIGSVKANVGHLDAAAGICGFIKLVCCLKHRQIPPQINFETPNPHLALEDSPFFVSTTKQTWFDEDDVYAGITSLGIGGTNAHVLLGPAPQESPVNEPLTGWNVFPISARSAEAVCRYAGKIGKHLAAGASGQSMTDIASTLQSGRVPFAQRSVIVADTLADAAAQFTAHSVNSDHVARADGKFTNLVFMFSGQGSQYENMAQGLYERFPVFRETFDYCVNVVDELSGQNVARLVFDEKSSGGLSTLSLDDTAITQPALFCVEYALAMTLMRAGIMPGMMLGHSIGEYVAACIAGVFTLDEALMLVVKRGALMQSLPKGTMLNANCDVATANSLRPDSVDIACINIDGAVVLSGPDGAVKEMQLAMENQGIDAVALTTSHAFHSSMMEPVLGEFEQCFATVKLQAPHIDVISNLTGLPLTRDQALSAKYWSRHLRETVQFSSSLDYIFKQGTGILVEVGPGRALSSLASRHRDSREHLILNTTRHAAEKTADEKHFFSAIGTLWQNGIKLDWNGLEKRRKKVPLPSYPFEQQQFWASNATPGANTGDLNSKANARQTDVVRNECLIDRWVQAPMQNVPIAPDIRTTCLIVNPDLEPQDSGHLELVGAEVEARGFDVITLQHKEEFSKSDTGMYCVKLDDELEVELLFEELVLKNIEISRVIALCFPTSNTPSVVNHPQDLQTIFDPLKTLTLIASCAARSFKQKAIDYAIVTQGAVSFQTPAVYPTLALLQVFNAHLSTIADGSTACLVDLEQTAVLDKTFLSRTSVLHDMLLQQNSAVIAYRSFGRWQKSTDATPVAYSGQIVDGVFKDKGCYLVVDDSEGTGLAIAQQLIELHGTTVLLCTTRQIPVVLDGLDVLATDLTDKDQFERRLNNTQSGLAAVKGVVYCCAPPDSTSMNELSVVLSPVVSGINTLEHVFSENQLEFLLLLSLKIGDPSKEDVIPAKVVANYVETKAFVQCSTGHTQWRSMNWISKKSKKASRDLLLSSLKNGQGMQSIERVLSLSGVHHVNVDLDWSVTTENNIGKDAVPANLYDPEKLPDPEKLRSENDPLQDDNTQGGAEGKVRERVRTIWCDETGLQTISNDDDYFSLGGTSLTALVIANRLKDEFSVEVDMEMIFENPTVGKLSRVLFSRIASSSHTDDVANLSPDTLGTLSVDQTPMWFFDLLHQNSQSNHLALAYTISGPLDIAKLQAALQKVVDRQAALRTVFCSDGESIEQQVSAHVPVVLNTEYAASDQVINNATVLSEHLKHSVLQKFNLAKGPLFRFDLVRSGVDQYVFLIVLHHIVADGQSFSVIFSNLNAYYSAQDTDVSDPLPVLESHYPDYVSWRNQLSTNSQFLESPMLEASSTAVSGKELARTLHSEIPPDYQRPSIQTAQGARLPISFTSSEIEAYKVFCKAKAISFYVLVLTAHYLLLRQRSGEQIACIGIPVSLREKRVHADFVGMCVNVVPAYISVPTTSSNDVLLTEVRQAVMHAMKNRYIAFIDTVLHFDPVRDMSRNPLYQTLVQLSPIPVLELDDLDTGFHSFDSGTAQVDLSIHLFEDSDNSIQGYFEFDTELYSIETVQLLILEFKNAMSALSENDRTPLNNVQSPSH